MAIRHIVGSCAVLADCHRSTASDLVQDVLAGEAVSLAIGAIDCSLLGSRWCYASVWQHYERVSDLLCDVDG